MKKLSLIRLMIAGFLSLCIIGMFCGCDKTGQNPDFKAGDFVMDISNPYFPLVPGHIMHYTKTSIYVGDTIKEDVYVTVTNELKMIKKVNCRVVHEVVKENEHYTEDTYKWYAQDKNGNVWYFGQNTKKLEDGQWNTDGSWEAGKKSAQPGIMMYGCLWLHTREPYRQDYADDVAEDRVEIYSLDDSVTVAYGTFIQCVKTRDYSDLTPDIMEYRYYAPGVGLVLADRIKGGYGKEELVSVKE
jgi:hypothetical protein